MPAKPTEEEIERSWRLAEEARRKGEREWDRRMTEIAIDQQKARDSWWYRHFGI